MPVTSFSIESSSVLGNSLGFRHLERFRFLLSAEVKQADLSLYVAAFVVLQLIEQRADRHQHFAAVVAETVKRTAADKTFHGAAVQVSALHALAEIVEGRERAVHRALGQNALYQAASEVADGEQTETNAVFKNRKALLALFTCGGSTAIFSLLHSSIYAGNLACGCEHTCEQRGHIFFRIVIFEVRRSDTPQRHTRRRGIY